MRKKSAPQQINTSVTSNNYVRMIVLWLFLVFPVYIPNIGGSGLSLPQNIATWVFVCVAGSFMLWPHPAKKRIVITPAWCWTAVGTLVLAIPLLYTRVEWLPAALWRQAGLMGGLLFWLACLQIHWSVTSRKILIYALLLAAFIQAVIALLQVFTSFSLMPFRYPLQPPRPAGVFQQINLLATFIALGMALALGVFLIPACLYQRYVTLQKCAVGGALFIFSVMLFWLQSRTGWLSGLFIVLTATLAFIRRPCRCDLLLALGIMLAGCLSAYLLMKMGIGIPPVSHANSNLSRIAMYRDAISMVAQKPFSGWGYGGFEFNFQHFHLQDRPRLYGDIVRYPHNELLYWLVDGGLVSGAGLGMFGIAAIRLIRDVWHRSIFRDVCCPLSLALLPLLIHTQTEYPFYLSAALWMIFILVLALLDSPATQAPAPLYLPLYVSRPLRCILLVTAFSMVAGALLPAFISNLALTRFEHQGLRYPDNAGEAMRYDRLINTERWDFDRQTSALLQYNRTREPSLLVAYSQWARDYLTRRTDRNVYANLIAIMQAQGQITLATRYHHEAQYLFPDDLRFTDVTQISPSLQEGSRQ